MGTRREASDQPSREGRPTPVMVIVAVALVGLLVVGGFAALAYRSISQRMGSARQLDQAIALAAEADTTVIAVDDVVRGELSADVATQAAESLPAIEQATVQLEQAAALADQAYPNLNDEERERSVALEEAVSARLAMLEAAEPILAVTIQAHGALGAAREGYALLVQSEKDTDEAVQQYNRLNEVGASASQNLNRKAKRELEEARSLLARAEAEFPQASMEAYQAYITARLELVELSLKSDAALIAGDGGEANRYSEQFNKAEETSAKAAQSLPRSPEEIIAEAYDAATEDVTTEYFTARNRASVADQRLRNP